MERESGSTWTLDELRNEFDRYSSLINAADLAPSSKTTYPVPADRFVRWLAGDVDIPPGKRPTG